MTDDEFENLTEEDARLVAVRLADGDVALAKRLLLRIEQVFDQYGRAREPLMEAVAEALGMTVEELEVKLREIKRRMS